MKLLAHVQPQTGCLTTGVLVHVGVVCDNLQADDCRQHTRTIILFSNEDTCPVALVDPLQGTHEKHLNHGLHNQLAFSSVAGICRRSS